MGWRMPGSRSPTRRLPALAAVVSRLVDRHLSDSAASHTHPGNSHPQWCVSLFSASFLSLHPHGNQIFCAQRPRTDNFSALLPSPFTEMIARIMAPDPRYRPRQAILDRSRPTIGSLYLEPGVSGYFRSILKLFCIMSGFTDKSYSPCVRPYSVTFRHFCAKHRLMQYRTDIAQ